MFAMRGGPNGRMLLAPPAEITSEEFDLCIEGVLRQALDLYHTTVAEDRDWCAPEGARNFIKKYLCISVTRLESGDLDVLPLHHQGSGYVGTKGEHIIVPKPDIPAKISSILKDAFAIAT